MGLLDLLKKLGILKMGGKAAVYTSAKDRPLDFMDDDPPDSGTPSGGKTGGGGGL